MIQNPSGEVRRANQAMNAVRRAFSEFLLVPTSVIGGFFLLALLSFVLDSVQFGWLAAFRFFLKTHIFADAQATSGLLGAIASSIITMTSITISLLLLAVQQSAGSMTSQVFDQFLRRWHNQFYFGFFIGLALYSLVTLATVNEPYNPVFGGSIALIGTIVALYMLLLLLYTTINQMRPVEVIEAIHELILDSREKQAHDLSRTYRASHYETGVHLPIRSQSHGFITQIKLDVLEKAIQQGEAVLEIELPLSVGDYVAFQDVIAIVKTEAKQSPKNAETIAQIVTDAVMLERQRDISCDPAYGIEQISMIAWTSMSTAKSNPAPGLLSILSLRDILARWSVGESLIGDEVKSETRLPVVYNDNVFERLLQAFETFAVVSSESMQHQNYIEILRTLTQIFDRLPPKHQQRVEDIILRARSALGDFVLTAELEQALCALATKLRASQRAETAEAVDQARRKLALSVGKLNSRSTRIEI